MNTTETDPYNDIVQRKAAIDRATRANCPTIASDPDCKRLTVTAIDKLEDKHGHKKNWRRLPVSNFLLYINTNMRSGDCFANCDNDARLYKWASPIVTAIRAGINHLFYDTKL